MSGGLRMPPGAGSDTLPTIPRQRTPSWAQPDPLDELAERLADFIAAAVHPDEIAALLESDGLSDDRIRERYGVRNSFALAEELYERVPRRYPEPSGPPQDPWRTDLLACLLRGLVFALPGFAYVLGAPLLAAPKGDYDLPSGTVPLLAGALFGWAWNQGLAHRAYTWLGLGDRPAARRCLLLGGTVGALLGAVTAIAASGTAPPTAAAFAAAQSCYLSAATALLVLGRERALLAALTPMTAGALLVLAHPIPQAAGLTLLLTSLAAATLLALLEVAPSPKAPEEGRWTAALTALLPFRRLDAGSRSHGNPPPCTRRRYGRSRGEGGAHSAAVPSNPRSCGQSCRWGGARCRRGDTPRARASAPSPTATPAPGTVPLSASFPYALFGLGSGVLVVHAALGDVLAGDEHAAVAAPAAVALTLSMGPAEWLLHRFRSRSLAALRAGSTPSAFRRKTSRTVIECLTAYLATLLTLNLATTALWPHAPAASGTRLTALLLLGLVMWTGLLLQSLGAVLGAALICALAALAQTFALAIHTGGPHTVGLAVYGAAAVAQSVLVCVLLGRATAHR